MAQTREQIAQVIESLNIGDTIVVTWEKSGNRSTEAGKVWQPPSGDYLGLGPDLLNPSDTELIGIVVTSRAPVQVAQPPVGSVAVFVAPGAANIYAYKRVKKGWQATGDRTILPWALIITAWKSPSAVFEPGTPPAAPTINSLTAGDRKITVAATLGSAGSTAVTDVQYNLVYEFEDGLGQESTGWLSSGQSTGNFTITNLEPGVDFTVRLRALNSSGTGPQSAPQTATPYTTPGAPIGVSATAGNAQAVLTWTAPSDFGYSPITGYKIEKILASNNDGWITVTESTGSTDTTYTVTGLTNGELIGFRVYAINAAGLGTPSASTSGVTPSAS